MIVDPSSRFIESDLTRDGAEVVAELGVEVLDTGPLPPLVEPDQFLLVTEPVDEPLVELAHARITPIERYRLAGWEQAVEGVWVRRRVAALLGQVADGLPDRWGLCVFDGWRPLALQQELYDAAYAHPGLPPGFLAVPSDDPLAPPPHLTGGSVDVSLTLDGIALGLGTRFDDFRAEARTDALEGARGPNRDLRRWLYRSMRSAGFVVFAGEWWHFEWGTRRWATITEQEPFYGPADRQ